MPRAKAESSNTTEPVVLPRELTVRVLRPENESAIQNMRRELARVVVIDSPAKAQLAATFLNRVRASMRGIKAKYKQVRKPVRQALDDISAMEREDLADYERADAAVSPALLAWSVEEEERRKAVAEQLLAEARSKAVDARAGQVDALKNAAAAAESPEQRRSLREQARQVERAPVLPVVTEALAPAPVKLEGISIPTTWAAEVVDLMQLARAVVEGRQPLRALLANQEFLDEQASSLEKDLNIPGVQAVQKRHLAARGVR